MFGDFKLCLQEFITKKIINNPFKSIRARSSSIYSTSLKGESKIKSALLSSSVAVILISIPGILSSLLLLYIPSKIGIVGFSAYTQQLQPQQNSLDQSFSSLQITQSKVQAATAPGTWGHGVPSLYNILGQDLLKILEITAVGCILAYLIIRILLNRAKEKEKGKMVMHQQQ